MLFKIIVHNKKKKIVTIYTKSQFTHPQVVPNLYDFLFSVEHNRIYFNVYVLFVYTIKVNGVQYLLLCSTEKKKKKTRLEQYESEQ